MEYKEVYTVGEVKLCYMLFQEGITTEYDRFIL